MWLEEVEELFKGYLPYYVLLILPVFIMISPINPVEGAYEFPVYRMQHYDLHGVSYGCRSATVNHEARSVTNWSTARHCVVTMIQDLTIERFRDIRTKAGALLIVVSKEFSSLSLHERQRIMALEDAMLSQETTIPVYFLTWSPDLEKILYEVTYNMGAEDKAKSAAEALIMSVAANGYQIVISPRSATAKSDIKIATLQGNLAGHSPNGKIPTIAVVAYYDSKGIAPELSFGAESNASGVVMLLELMRLFSVLYSDVKTRGRYNIIFLLTGGGKFNFQGSKKWLEDQLDSLETSLIQDAAYVLCLDTVSINSSVYMHVSKPPKEGSPASLFYSGLKTAASHYPNITVDAVHKKINLAEDVLAWEHERYSIRRLPAFTISSLRTHRDSIKSTIIDTKKGVDMAKLIGNTQLVVEALATHIYNTSGREIFSQRLKVERASLEGWLSFISSEPRAAQLLCTKDNGLVYYLQNMFNKYLRDVRVTYATPDKRDPDFMFYEVTESTVNVYHVKPAIFDLILTLVILLYLGSIYLLIQNFSFVYAIACTISYSKPKSVKSL